MFRFFPVIEKERFDKLGKTIKYIRGKGVVKVFCSPMPENWFEVDLHDIHGYKVAWLWYPANMKELVEAVCEGYNMESSPKMLEVEVRNLTEGRSETIAGLIEHLREADEIARDERLPPKSFRVEKRGKKTVVILSEDLWTIMGLIVGR